MSLRPYDEQLDYEAWRFAGNGGDSPAAEWLKHRHGIKVPKGKPRAES